MLKFYDVTNKGRGAKSHFIIAKDKEDAMRIAATEPGTPIRAIEMTQSENIPKLCQGTKTGILAMKVQALTFNQVFGIDPKPTQPVDPWFFIKEI